MITAHEAQNGLRDSEYKALAKHMRSPKSRSRSKSNRNRPQNTGGNVVNRVFDSSGPEGKVRGTPQQIIDKYNQLTRDAQLSNDRVAAENFQQHAEHYLRLLGEAMREMDQRREEQERFNRDRQADRDRERADREAQQPAVQEQQPQAQSQPQTQPRDTAAEPQVSASMMPPMPVDPAHAGRPVFAAGSDDSGLVETPESKPSKPRQRRKPKPKAEDDTPEAAE
jgi:hypothetical protein